MPLPVPLPLPAEACQQLPDGPLRLFQLQGLLAQGIELPQQQFLQGIGTSFRPVHQGANLANSSGVLPVVPYRPP